MIEKISLDYRDQPSLEALAEEVGETPTGAAEALHPLGRPSARKPSCRPSRSTMRAGCSTTGMPLLETAYEVGMSGPGRLHDLFVTHEAMSPGDYKTPRRRPDHPLRLPSLAVRRGADHGHRPRTCRPGLQRRRRRARGLRRHGRALAERQLCRGHVGDRALCGAHLRPDALARRPAAARRHDRHRFPAARLGGPAEDPDGPGTQLFLDRRAASAHRRPAALSARRSAPIRCPSWCPATARSASPARSPATIGG